MGKTSEGADEPPSGAPSTAGRVLVVEDEPLVRRLVERALGTYGFAVESAKCGAEALEILAATAADDLDVVLTDLHLGDLSGMEVLVAAQRAIPDVGVVVMTALGTVPAAVAAMRAGAYDFILKPFEPIDDLVTTIARAVERRRLIARNSFLETKLAQAVPPHGLVGDSKVMRTLLSRLDAVAPVSTTVLVVGESGTGKELVARAIHDRSGRAKRPFLAINCGALAESVLESELFGHVRGAFTGATTSRRGLFEEASGGTLFLDEIGEAPLSTQVRLLRVLEQGEIRPVGANDVRKVDVRVVAATNRDLAAAIRAGTFREDLYYRLDVVKLEVPPLRDRLEDVPLLTHRFLATLAERFERPPKTIDAAALRALCAHSWPGNVRELRNTVERMVLFSPRSTLALDDLPANIGAPRSSKKIVTASPTLGLAASLEACERTYIEQALHDSNGSVREAARSAGVDPSNFRRLLKRHGIEPRPSPGDTDPRGSE